MAAKKFIRSSNDVIMRELEKLQNKVNFLETNVKPRKTKKTAIYSPPIEVEAQHVEVEFETDAEMFTVNK
jgi:hypothetical protein